MNAATGPSGRRFAFLAELRPDGPSSLPHPASQAQTAQRVAQLLGPDAVAWAVERGQELATAIIEQVPGHRSDDGRDIMRAGTEAAALSLLAHLAGPRLAEPATSDNLGGVEDFVRRGMTLEEMLRGIRIGHALLTRRLLEACPPREVPFLSEQVFAFFDAFSDRMGEEFRAQEARWAASDAAGRMEVVEALLAGRYQETGAASAALRHDLARTQIGLIAWTTRRTDEDADGDVARALNQLLAPMVRDGLLDQRLVLPAGVGVAWAWITPKPQEDEEPVTDWAALLDSSSIPRHLHVAVGVPRRGVAGFRDTHDDALAVFSLLVERERAPRVVSYRQVDAASLLLADRSRALRFARDELGGLGSRDPGVADLRRTVAVYLELSGSPKAAAERLLVSRNTVTYRVHRAEELLGRPLSERTLQLQAALAVLEAAG